MKKEKETRLNTYIVMGCTLLSRLLGIVKARAISTVFGASNVADTINFTFNIPNNFRKLFAEGALSAAIIPTFTAIKEDKEKTQALFAKLLAIQLLLFIPLIILTWVLRYPIIEFLSGFTAEGQIELSSSLLPYFIVFLATISISAYFSSILQCRGAFLIQALAPLLFSLSLIFSVVFLTPTFGAFSMAIGTVVGGFLQALCTFIRLRAEGIKLKLSFSFSDETTKKVLKAWLPVIATSAVGIINQQIAVYFASTLSAGSVTAFTNSIIIWQTPYGIFFTAVGTVFFPLMSSNKDNLPALTDNLSEGLTKLFTYLLPSAIIIFTLSNETVSTLLQGGAFTSADTMLTASVLRWYLMGMVFVAWYAFLQRFSYSRLKYKTTLLISIAVAIMDVVSAFVFLKAGVGVSSLPIANGICYLFGTIMLYLICVKPIKEFSLIKLIPSFLKIILANIPLILCAVFYCSKDYSWWVSGGSLRNLCYLAALYGVGGLLTLILYKILKIKI